jgi:hypothetical protein
MNTKPDAITRLFRACEPNESLQPDDPRYVNCDEVRGESLVRIPVTRVAAEKAVRNYANSLLREVPDDYWDRLRRFGEAQEDIPKDEAHQKMLYLLHVFEYLNGRPWYEVNPVLRTLPRFSRQG